MINEAQQRAVLVVVLVGLPIAGLPPAAAAQTTSTGAAVTIGSIVVSPDEPTTESRTIITPTIVNSQSASGNVKLTEVSIRDGGVLNTADNLGRLGPGDSIDVPLSHTFEEPGEHRIVVTVRGIAPDNSVFVVQKSAYIAVDERATDVGVSANVRSVNGSTGIAATFTQYGTVTVESGEVQVQADGRIISRAPVATVAGGESRTVRFEGGDIPAGDVTIRAEYTLTDEQQSRATQTTVRYTPQRAADMALTGIETTARGTTYTISGDASNLGSGDAHSVLVDVAPTDGLSSNGGYFVGAIETSEFATFELTVTADAAVTQIPVRVNYSVDGEQFSETVPIDVSQRVTVDTNGGRSSPQPERMAGGLPLTILAAAALVGLAAVVYRWRSS